MTVKTLKTNIVLMYFSYFYSNIYDSSLLFFLYFSYLFSLMCFCCFNKNNKTDLLCVINLINPIFILVILQMEKDANETCVVSLRCVAALCRCDVRFLLLSLWNIRSVLRGGGSDEWRVEAACSRGGASAESVYSDKVISNTSEHSSFSHNATAATWHLTLLDIIQEMSAVITGLKGRWRINGFYLHSARWQQCQYAKIMREWIKNQGLKR